MAAAWNHKCHLLAGECFLQVGVIRNKATGTGYWVAGGAAMIPDIDYTSFALGALWFMGTMVLAAFLDIHITRWMDNWQERRRCRKGNGLSYREVGERDRLEGWKPGWPRERAFTFDKDK